jgi:hypothetical protein
VKALVVDVVFFAALERSSCTIHPLLFFFSDFHFLFARQPFPLSQQSVN